MRDVSRSWGFSHGGGTVLAAASPAIARSQATVGTPPFRVLIAFYPRCEGRYPGRAVALGRRARITVYAAVGSIPCARGRRC